MPDKLFQELMELWNNLIRTVGLDKSFFYQLVMAVTLYFISKKLFFEPYLKKQTEREERTKGRMIQSRKIELRVERKKQEYERKAKAVHREFQEVFNAIKLRTKEDYEKENLKIEKEQKLYLVREREKLHKALREQEKALEEELAPLARLLAEKIRG